MDECVQAVLFSVYVHESTAMRCLLTVKTATSMEARVKLRGYNQRRSRDSINIFVNFKPTLVVLFRLSHGHVMSLLGRFFARQSHTLLVSQRPLWERITTLTTTIFDQL